MIRIHLILIILLEVADSFGLDLSISVNFLDNSQDSNSVLDLIFLRTRLKEFNNHLISPDLQSLLDPLSVSIIVEKEFILEKKWSIIRNIN